VAESGPTTREHAPGANPPAILRDVNASLKNQAKGSGWQLAVHALGLDLDRGLEPAIYRMEARRAVLVAEHADDDAEETRDLRD